MHGYIYHAYTQNLHGITQLHTHIYNSTHARIHTHITHKNAPTHILPHACMLFLSLSLSLSSSTHTTRTQSYPYTSAHSTPLLTVWQWGLPVFVCMDRWGCTSWCVWSMTTTRISTTTLRSTRSPQHCMPPPGSSPSSPPSSPWALWPECSVRCTCSFLCVVCVGSVACLW